MSEGPGSVHNLKIWRDGIKLVKTVYELTKMWPKEEIYGLTSQVRRASVSIPANIAEGIGRGTPEESSRFTQIALGSAYELDTLIVIATELGYSPKQSISQIQTELQSLLKSISSFIRYQEGKR
jgi:four helix bundle protein